jgi:hypothetical protein
MFMMALVDQEHPRWKDQALSYQYTNKSGRTVSGLLALQSVGRQLEILKCE